MTLVDPIRIFSSWNELQRLNPEKSLNILLKAFANDFSQQEREIKFGSRARYFTLCSELTDADYYVLPMNWEFYESNKLINMVIENVEIAKKANKPVIVFNSWDFPAKLPFSSAIVLETAGYYSRRYFGNNLRLGLPAFIGDYLPMYCDNKIIQSPARKKPSVGFCGQASRNYTEFLYRELRRKMRSALFHLGAINVEPPPFETTKFRGDVLDKLASSTLLDTHFVLRNKYRAGYHAPKKDPKHSTRMEFIQNILDTDYTVCMRGGGNFSVRFYETLSLGGIPVFVNTDCLLPFCDQINYSDYFVWVDMPEISMIDQKIIQFQRRFANEGLFNAQRKCRELWEEYFSMGGYFYNLAVFLKDPKQKLFGRKP